MSWDWQVFCQDTISQEVGQSCFGQGGDITYLDWLLSAWGWTISVSLLSLVIALVVGAVVGTLRTLPHSPWTVRLGNAWVEFFRNIPLLVHIFLWYHVLPAMIPALKSLPGFVLVVCALGFFTSARIAEQVRSGIQALPRGQRYAGMAMGFTTWQTYRYVLLPMALRIIIPPLTSQYLNLIKNSSLAVAVGYADLVAVGGTILNQSGKSIEIISIWMLIYVSISLITSLFMNWFNAKMALVER